LRRRATLKARSSKAWDWREKQKACSGLKGDFEGFFSLLFNEVVIPRRMRRPFMTIQALSVLPMLATIRTNALGGEGIPETSTRRFTRPDIQWTRDPLAFRTENLGFAFHRLRVKLRRDETRDKWWGRWNSQSLRSSGSKCKESSYSRC
jgi:hypothetical protein